MKIKRVLKFGGTSLGSPDAIRRASAIIREAAQRGAIAVVVSAFSGVTDQLLCCARWAEKQNPELRQELRRLRMRHFETARKLFPAKLREEARAPLEQLFKELEGRLMRIEKGKAASVQDLDAVAGIGERLSAPIIAAYLNSFDTKRHPFRSYTIDARGLIKTDSCFGRASVDFVKTDRNIKEFFHGRPGGKNMVPVLTGFIGSTDGGETTTLGRGGADYTAAIVAAAIDAKLVEIWTDVDGVMSADPNLVTHAYLLPQLTYSEAIEMAYFGAKVIHPATMLPAIKKKIPILIKNTFNPSSSGTLISHGASSDNNQTVKGITAIDDVAIINIGGVSLAGIPGSAARVFKATAAAGANVVLISQASSEHTICIAIKRESLAPALYSLRKEFREAIKQKQVTLHTIKDQSIVAVVGDGMRGTPGVAGKLFNALAEHGINISAIAQGGSERNISLVVKSSDKAAALNVIHNAFLRVPPKHIFLAGTGNIGGKLLEQMKAHPHLRVCGLINTDFMLSDSRGIQLDRWSILLGRGQQANVQTWLSRARTLNLSNKIFVDCTASKKIARQYCNIARAGFHIVTPNKIFNVLPFDEYQKLRRILAQNNKRFLYETTVGAAMPIISTLRDLVASGDGITRIEGIFSGTLSYILSAYDGKRPFSSVVLEAKEKGYTEPDPRTDLSGEDVGRKLLILAREIGLPLEMEDIKVQSLVPPPLRKVKSADSFLARLKDYDKQFEKLCKRARVRGRALRYVATLQGRRASVSLKEIPLTDPLSSTRGADNIFVFYTKRYNERPLVVQGPGAGAAVTAGGVLTDILKI